MKKVLFLMVTLICISCSAAYADYIFDFKSNDGSYGVKGIFYTASNGNGPLLITGATITGDGTLNNNVSYALLAPFLTAQNSDGHGANLSGADNLLYPDSNPVFDPADPNNGIILVQSTNLPNNPLVVNGSVNTSTNNDPAIGIWANGSNNYEYFASWDYYSTGTATLIAAPAFAAPVPEPSTLFLLGAGLAGVGILRRRFKK